MDELQKRVKLKQPGNQDLHALEILRMQGGYGAGSTVRCLRRKPEDRSSDLQNPHKFQVGMSACRQFQPERKDTGDPQGELTRETDHISELGV